MDVDLGAVPILEAHEPPGLLHRAVSVCLIDPKGRLVLQQRAEAKSHFARRWSNACCTHPEPGEHPEQAASRRTLEELGLVAPPLTYVGSFVYHAADPESGLTEHELDHVFVGVTDSEPRPCRAEVMDWRYAYTDELHLGDTAETRYTPWLGRVVSLALSGRP